jgi:hypothetical protein
MNNVALIRMISRMISSIMTIFVRIPIYFRLGTIARHQRNAAATGQANHLMQLIASEILTGLTPNACTSLRQQAQTTSGILEWQVLNV